MDLLEYKEMRRKTQISSATINITDDCNLRCRYCFTSHNTRVISIDTLKAAANFMYKEASRFLNPETIAINFFGGEPMLHFTDLIHPFVLWCEKEIPIKIKFNITTNGTLLTEYSLKFMKEHNFGVLLSIDGDEETQNYQRPMKDHRESFEKVKNNIPNLLKYFPDTTFRSTLQSKCASNLFDNYRFAKKMGFKNFFVIPNVYEEWNNNYFLMNDFSLSFIMKYIYEDIKENNSCLNFSELNKMIKLILLKNSYQNTNIRCGLGTVGIGIDCDGIINGCQEHNTYQGKDVFHIGNVFDGINEIDHLKLINLYNAILSLNNRGESERCKNCLIKDYCKDFLCPSREIGVPIKQQVILCYWYNGLYKAAKGFLELAEKDDNENINNYLKKMMNEVSK